MVWVQGESGPWEGGCCWHSSGGSFNSGFRGRDGLGLMTAGWASLWLLGLGSRPAPTAVTGGGVPAEGDFKETNALNVRRPEGLGF